MDILSINFNWELWNVNVTETVHRMYDSTDEMVYLIDFVPKNNEVRMFEAEILVDSNRKAN